MRGFWVNMRAAAKLFELGRCQMLCWERVSRCEQITELEKALLTVSGRCRGTAGVFGVPRYDEDANNDELTPPQLII
jgi:hypothetical protein